MPLLEAFAEADDLYDCDNFLYSLGPALMFAVTEKRRDGVDRFAAVAAPGHERARMLCRASSRRTDAAVSV